MSKFRIKTEIGRTPFEMEVEIPEETMRRIIDSPNWKSLGPFLSSMAASRSGVFGSSCFPLTPATVTGTITPPKEVMDIMNKYLQEHVPGYKERADHLKDVFKDDKAVPSDKKEKPNKKE